MEPSRIELFGDITILLLIDESAARPPRLAAAAAGRLAAQLGATVLGASDEVADEAAWATDGPGRILLRAESTSVAPPTAVEGINVVRVVADPWHNEATLFAAAGLSELLGDPAGAPQVPAGQWGAMTVGYAVLAALASVRALALGGEADVVTVDCVDALRWVNWKAIALADLDRPITREGADSAWPILPCVDGHVALVHTPRDFAAIVAMVDDDRLRADRFARARDRATDPAAYLSIVAEWAAGRTRAELDRAFLAHGVPAAAVVSPAELVDDVMLRHRRAFTSVVVDGCEIPTPVAPVRVRSEPNPVRQPGSSTSPAAAALGSLPLAGVRVLDLGVLTAGAGTSSLLADLGAEVIKIESRVKPDMLRFWAGEDDSPLFHFSNRSKYGVDLNLKDPAGRSAFLALVATADVVIENYRRGVLERLDLDFDVLREANPTVTLASISGQGLDGPLAGHTTFGSTLEATSGFSALTTDEAGRPMISGANLNYPDQTVCLFAAAVIVAAVTTVRRTGAATHLDVSQRDVAIYACGPVLEQLARGGAPATWPARLDASGGWVAEGADGTEQPVLTGPQLLEACRAEASTAVIDAPYGGLTKGFPFRFSSRTMTISGPAPAIGQDDDRYLIPRPNSREHA